LISTSLKSAVSRQLSGKTEKSEVFKLIAER